MYDQQITFHLQQIWDIVLSSVRFDKKEFDMHVELCKNYIRLQRLQSEKDDKQQSI